MAGKLSIQDSVGGVKVQGLEGCDVHGLLAASLTRRTC